MNELIEKANNFLVEKCNKKTKIEDIIYEINWKQIMLNR